MENDIKKDLVKALIAGDKEEFEEAIKPALQKRVETLLKLRKIDISKNLMGG